MSGGSVHLEHVSRSFRVYPQRNMTLKEAIVRRREVRPVEVRALKDVTLEIQPGEAVGFVGRNGSGKTTLLRLLAGIFPPSSGRLEVEGRVGTLLEIGAGFHGDFTGRDNVFLSGAIYGLSKRQIARRLDEIVAFAELEEFIDLPVRTYSAGMYMRLGFSVATNVDADILLLDEVFAVGDEAFQRKCIDRIFDFKRSGGTIAFVSHSASAVEQLCDRAVLLRKGEVEIEGSTHDVLHRYQALLAKDERPGEREAGLREWGTGEVRIAGVRLEPGGEELQRFDAESPFAVEVAIDCVEVVPAPLLVLEIRAHDGALVGIAETELADDLQSGARMSARFELERLPLLAGRFSLTVALTDRRRRHQYHRIERVRDFEVEGDRADGWVRLDGQWSLSTESSRLATP